MEREISLDNMNIDVDESKSIEEELKEIDLEA
eukprot:CAMPEP_0202966946 /NCGR_PEP_ID=MMETSP1396-20130829/11614_1 /ASSEMBLY_ACC=CAM_ASM_000872 /TAXON_ID= /ORGANISM="Pseudokeronopsis sp., Strain Brazil" /LENGTH=31 /DNA_ID= /DNA_START= /DNA_END= /DNA_ORIENTATION=